MSSKIRNGVLAVSASGALVLGGFLAGPGIATAASLVDGSAIVPYSIGSHQLKHGGVPSAKIKDYTIGSRDIKHGGVSGAKVKDGSLGLADLSQDAQDALKGQDGQDGAPGDDGADGTNGTNGTNGEDGADGVSGYEIIGVEKTVTAGAVDQVQACPDGKYAVGGGYTFDQGAEDVTVASSAPAGLTQMDDGRWVATGWEVKAQVGSTNQLQVFANCASLADVAAQ